MTKRTSDRPKLNLDAVLETRAPDFELGGIEFEGRMIGWTIGREFDKMDTSAQLDYLVEALKSRASDAELITPEWIDKYLTLPAVQAVIGLLFRGERPA
jgi:hypothetical protein